jgi:hypothetical protein
MFFAKLVVASFATSIMTRANCRSIGPQNGLMFCEHVVQKPHVVLSKALPTFVHHFTHVGGNYLPI